MYLWTSSLIAFLLKQSSLWLQLLFGFLGGMFSFVAWKTNDLTPHIDPKGFPSGTGCRFISFNFQKDLNLIFFQRAEFQVKKPFFCRGIAGLLKAVGIQISSEVPPWSCGWFVNFLSHSYWFMCFYLFLGSVKPPCNTFQYCKKKIITLDCHCLEHKYQVQFFIIYLHDTEWYWVMN